MTAEPPETPDYRAMDNENLLYTLSDDAAKWAEAFCQLHGDKLPDEGNMICWFANAIEHSSDVRRWREERAAKGDTVLATPPLK